MNHLRAMLRALSAPLLLAATASTAPPREVCRNETGMHRGLFYTFWKSGGDACMVLGERGHYTTRYRLLEAENLVAGSGWRTGSASRKIGYRARQFDGGTNSYLTLYGWSVAPLVEYYVVDSWGSNFTPPGADAPLLGTVTSDGGTYNIYRTRRIEQPSIRGTATFDQYWSVRTSRRPLDRDNVITFSNHLNAWRSLGMRLGRMDYQVLATEGFGSSGASDLAVWQE